jgi:trigger factor
LPREKAEGLDVEVTFTIEEINEREPAELTQELFDRLFGPDQVHSEEEMRDKIKSDSEAQFQQQSDQKLLNDVTEKLIEDTTFDLPTEFMKKWMQTTGEKPLSTEEVNDEFERTEKGLRYQLIEGKLIKEHGLDIQFEELKEFAKGFIRSQMAQYGQTDPKDEDLEAIAARVMSNQDEVKRLSEQLMSQKLLDLYKEKANLKTKEVTYEAFVKEVYG